MEFPITDLLNYGSSVDWITEYFHPAGFNCPECGVPRTKARVFRKTLRSGLFVYRCCQCDMVYKPVCRNHFPANPSDACASGFADARDLQRREFEGFGRRTKVELCDRVDLRHLIQANAEKAQPETALPDQRTETDEMFQNAGKR
jgi:hypothetical protein